MNQHLLSNISIKEAAPHIFRRPFLFVEPNANMFQIATFLAIDPQIYVDGIVVINERNKCVGRISSKHIIFNILKTGYPECLEINASQLMDNFVGNISMDWPLSRALEVFDKTKFAFVPIISKDDIPEVTLTTLSIRDVLPLIATSNINTPIKNVSSPLLSVDKNESITNTLDFMLEKKIRNIGIKEADRNDNSNNNNNNTKLIRIINDRKILEFLLSHNGRKIMCKEGTRGLTDINIIDHLDMISVAKVESSITVSNAAKLLMDIRNPCLILRERNLKSIP